MSRRAHRALDPLQSEIRFRRFHKKIHEPVLDYMALAYRERQPLFADLERAGYALSPFVEIGAETGPNALALVNGLGAVGAACDISFDALAAMPAYAEKLKAETLPVRIVCDAANLPFQDHSIPFVLAWGTLHHFPQPEKALSEIKRILHPDGIFYFDGEPVKRRVSANLWTTKAYFHMGPVQRVLLEAGLLPYLAAIDGAEAIQAGVTELKPTLAAWESLMKAFDSVQWRYSPYITATIPSAGRHTRRLINRLLRPENPDRTIVDLFGGAVGGVCRMDSSDSLPSPPAADIEQALACPDCASKPGLERRGETFFSCPTCGRRFEEKQSLITLLDNALQTSLYNTPGDNAF